MLDKPIVKFVEVSSPYPRRAIIEAFRKCYKSEGNSDSDWKANKIGPKDQKLLQNGIINGHLTPFEFCDFTFDITLSRAAHTQLVRHRMSSFCAESGRHCAVNEFFIPKAIANNPAMASAYHDLFYACHRFHNQMMDAGIKLEDARYILPMAAMSEIRYKANLHSLRNAIAERTCKKAHAEIRMIFFKIKEMVREYGEELLFKVEKYDRCPIKCGECL